MAREKHSILFATKNPGKLAEFKEVFSKLSTDYEIVSFRDLTYDIPDCGETGTTFGENARLKVCNARQYLRGADKNLIVVGDDSGMRISCLNGEPGVYTRRWNGSEMTDGEIIAYCLDKMRGVNDRSAEYVTYFAVLTPDDDIAIINGENRGIILERSRRSSLLPGLPFRALFFVPELSLMFHEVREFSVEERKGYILGHEQAIQQIITYLDKKSAEDLPEN